MNYQSRLVCVFLMFFTATSWAQPESTYLLNFKTVFGNQPLSTGGAYYKITGNDSMRVDLVKYYISNIQLLQDSGVVWQEKSSYHLVDADFEQSGSLKLIIPTGLRFDSVKFGLGIDSLTNVAGALGGDLDPTKGMYWTWQSGYINCKIEGACNLCPTRKNEFQFHLGGYQPPFYAYQSVVLKLAGSSQTDVELDIKKILTAIDLTRQHKVMLPGTEAVNLSALMASAFSCQLP